MSSAENNEVRYDIVFEENMSVSEADIRREAVRGTYSLLRQWRSRFTDEVIDLQKNKAKTVTLSSTSPTDAVAEVKAQDGSRLTHEVSGPDGDLEVMEYPVDGEPRKIEGDFVSQHTDLARIIFDFDREIARG